VLYSPSVDDSSTIAKEILQYEWRGLILSARKMVRDGDDSMADATVDDAMDEATGDDAMDDATGDDATDHAMIEVDEVLDKLLDNAIEAYGLSARDVY
jgi:hypothetical protein